MYEVELSVLVLTHRLEKLRVTHFNIGVEYLIKTKQGAIAAPCLTLASKLTNFLTCLLRR